MDRRDFVKGMALTVGGLAGGAALNLRLKGDAALAADSRPAAGGNAMEYRQMRRVSVPVSAIGIGSGNLHRVEDREIREIIRCGYENGVNLIDLIAVNSAPFAPIAAEVKPRRDKFRLQAHLGADFSGGSVSTTRDLARVKSEFERMLRIFDTDYMDFGIIHYVDAMDDFRDIMDSGIWSYMKQLKSRGAIRNLGFCSHTLSICKAFVDTGDVDCFMTSVNPIYDFSESGGRLTMSQERMEFYRDCEKNGVGIHVMKALAGGSLIDRRLSQMERPLSVHQCFQYALDRPAVQSCLAGVSSIEEMREIAPIFTLPFDRRDYSALSGMNNSTVTNGSCIYCNHCQPCAAGIDIGIVNKYYDLARAGDEMARRHYDALKVHASACIKCGNCDKNCHFGVKPSERMALAAKFFGK
ncbi:MAG: aldo/keto reductase [Synergistaceae bacterium]|nr:aldo/keto reductase [Synergistaceae bacterium]